MKAALILAPALLALSLSAAAFAPASARPVATAPQDTIIIRLPNKVVMTLLVRDAAQLKQLKTYHLDSLTSRLGAYITQAEAAAKASKTERVTVEFYPDRDQPGQNLPEQVRITTTKAAANRNRVEVMLNKKLGMNVRINSDDVDGDGKSRTIFESNSGRQQKRDSAREAKGRRLSGSKLQFDVGLNAFVNRQPTLTSPSEPELRPEGSRYVNIGYAYFLRLGGKQSPMRLSLGAEISYNNYMLAGNNRWVNTNGRTEVVPVTDGRELQKSKLATSSINVPLMLTARFRNANGRPAFRIGAGGFIGQLQRQRTKEKYTQDGDVVKDKNRGSFNLNEFQYGLQGNLGLGGLSLFAKYNLNKLFKENRGPQLQVLSFGIAFSEI